MGQQHTPGPWTTTEARHPIRDTLGVKGPQGQWVALVHPLTGPERSPEAAGNAMLIASAPDLLAALKAMLAKHDDRDGMSDLWPKEAAQARAAIAAAEAAHPEAA